MRIIINASVPGYAGYGKQPEIGHEIWYKGIKCIIYSIHHIENTRKDLGTDRFFTETKDKYIVKLCQIKGDVIFSVTINELEIYGLATTENSLS